MIPNLTNRESIILKRRSGQYYPLPKATAALLRHLFNGPVTITGAILQKQPGTCLGKGYLKPTLRFKAYF